MINIGIIGLGTIFSTQIKALNALYKNYRIVALCDYDEARLYKIKEMVSKQTDDIPAYYLDSDAFFAHTDMDAVLIATPPENHYELAMHGINLKKDILLEKPATMCLRELEHMYAEAKRQNVILHVAFHASFAEDLIWFLNNYGVKKHGDLEKIECHFYDPYYCNGILQSGKHLLGGCYIDSGVNALSVCDKITDISTYSLLHKEECVEKEFGVVYESHNVYTGNNEVIEIYTGWNKNINHKSTTISYKNSNIKILLDHTKQSVYLIEENQRILLYSQDKTERLEAQYKNVFCDFASAIKKRAGNQNTSLKIHNLLLK